MPLLSFKATKMSEANVSHISLVERGANRIPFKIVKQEKDMAKFTGLDLGSIFTKKAEKPVPQIVGVVTMKGEGFESVKRQIEEAGFDVGNMEEAEDGSVIFKQGEATEGDVVVRLNDHVAVVTKGFSPYSMDMAQDGVTFAETCAAKGFYPGISTIMETLGDAVRSQVYSAKSPSDAKSAVAKVFSEAAAYTQAFLSGLPVKAFKLETITVEKAETVEGQGEGEQSAEANAVAAGEGAAAGAEGGEGAVEKGEGAPAATGNADDASSKDPEGDGVAKTGEQEVKAGLTQDEVSSIVASQVTKALAESLSPVLASIETVAKSVQAIGGTVDTLSGRIEATEQVAKAAQEAVTGTVVTGSESGDATTATAKKSETREFGDIDTAFRPRNKFPRR